MSPATRPSGGPSPAARPCTCAASAAASSGPIPAGDERAYRPRQDVSGSRCARFGPPDVTTRTSPSGIGDHGRRSLQQHDAPGVLDAATVSRILSAPRGLPNIRENSPAVRSQDQPAGVGVPRSATSATSFAAPESEERVGVDHDRDRARAATARTSLAGLGVAADSRTYHDRLAPSPPPRALPDAHPWRGTSNDTASLAGMFADALARHTRDGPSRPPLGRRPWRRTTPPRTSPENLPPRRRPTATCELHAVFRAEPAARRRRRPARCAPGSSRDRCPRPRPDRTAPGRHLGGVPA